MCEPKYVITIGRQFGSGGREIGMLLAQKLNIKYYDKELLAEAANNTGVSKEFFEAADEKSPGFFDNIFSYNLTYNASSFFVESTPLSPGNIYSAQSNVIRDLAEKNSCVIVGRSADYILRNHPCCINIFIHASLDDRIKRITTRKDCLSKEDAKNIAEKKDKLRAGYYNFYTDKEWGKASSYDLCINSTNLSASEVADIIIEFAKVKISTAFQE
ncbi:MAG: cytidylate kinase-like family protein [Muribaculaceae bacterium]|nr:cytidylate kinase-like family protein [Muribaculaceae bacterium]